MDRFFDEELKNLNAELIAMSSIVVDMIRESILALTKKDEALINDVRAKENAVNAQHIAIDDAALKLLALRQPAASDLRLIVAAMKINSDLERIADLAVNIVRCTRDLIKEPPTKLLSDIPNMSEIAENMVADALKAFNEKDSKRAKDVCKRDDVVDDLDVKIFRELIACMIKDSKSINCATELILISRYIERIADHATNIAEDAIYMVAGKDIRHHIADERVE